MPAVTSDTAMSCGSLGDKLHTLRAWGARAHGASTQAHLILASLPSCHHPNPGITTFLASASSWHHPHAGISPVLLSPRSRHHDHPAITPILPSPSSSPPLWHPHHPRRLRQRPAPHLPLPACQPLVPLPLADVVGVSGLEGVPLHGPLPQARLPAQPTTQPSAGALPWEGERDEAEGCGSSAATGTGDSRVLGDSEWVPCCVRGARGRGRWAWGAPSWARVCPRLTCSAGAPGEERRQPGHGWVGRGFSWPCQGARAQDPHP